MTRLILVGAFALAFLSACSTRRDDDMGDMWKIVRHTQQNR